MKSRIFTLLMFVGIAAFSQGNIVFFTENVTHCVEATVHIAGKEIHAKASAPEMYGAIDILVDRLMGQLTKHKEKVTQHH